MREFSVPALTEPPTTGGLAESVFTTALAQPDLAALSRRTQDGSWQTVTAAQFRDEVVAIAKGLLHQGVRFGDRVALMSRTRYEWTVLDYALWTIGAQPVPVYPTSSAEQVRWILADSKAVACVVEHEDHAMTVGSVVEGLPELRSIWQLDAGALRALELAGRGVSDDLLDRHRQAVTPESTATVIYTSGTTGRPKGCVLTHANFAAETDNVVARYQEVFQNKSSEQPATLLFLPLAHVFGRMVQVAALRAGVRLSHEPSLAPADLMPALESNRPTFILAVPYIFEKLLQRAREVAEEAGKLGPFEKAVDAAVRYAAAVERHAFGDGPGPSPAQRVQHQVYDRMVYSKVRAVLGGRVRHAFSGGSAMNRELGLFFAGAGITVYEGYGLTECTAAATANPPDRPRFGTVGHPVPGTSVRIADDGEVWINGGQVFQGYLNDPQASGLTLHDGWLATGDLGHLDEDGYLTITGRKKEIIVTSSGKSVAPAVLEDRVRSHPLVAHCMLVGDNRPYIGALLVLDPDALVRWQRQRGKPDQSAATAARQDPDLQAELQRSVAMANTAVSRAESIRAYRVLPGEFTEDRGLLTPSLKIRRRAVATTYATDIDALYASAGASS
ncbi:long-chain acyl-CoA synthetase [Streptomyces sp. 846.5]|nr:AMP-dependent synthetase/ligase [Streptomyces sp. 846.5]TDT95868.1 long-chain acyl-CoA synthetase [Streptomyces sp. 846.5]